MKTLIIFLKPMPSFQPFGKKTGGGGGILHKMFSKKFYVKNAIGESKSKLSVAHSWDAGFIKVRIPITVLCKFLNWGGGVRWQNGRRKQNLTNLKKYLNISQSVLFCSLCLSYEFSTVVLQCTEYKRLSYQGYKQDNMKNMKTLR